MGCHNPYKGCDQFVDVSNGSCYTLPPASIEWCTDKFPDHCNVQTTYTQQQCLDQFADVSTHTQPPASIEWCTDKFPDHCNVQTIYTQQQCLDQICPAGGGGSCTLDQCVAQFPSNCNQTDDLSDCIVCQKKDT